MINVFIGYRKDTEKAVEKLACILRGLGIEVWEFESSLVPGDEFTQKINNSISRISDCVIFILNEEAFTSNFLKNFEIKWALERKNIDNEFLVIPILYKEEFSLLKNSGIMGLSSIQGLKLLDVSFSSIADIAQKIFYNVLKLKINPKDDFLSMCINDRVKEAPSANYLLNIDLTDLFDINENIINLKWKRAQIIFRILSETIQEVTPVRNIKLKGRMRYTTSFLLGYAFRLPIGFKFSINYYDLILETPDQFSPTTSFLKRNEIVSDFSTDLIINFSLTQINQPAINEFVKSQDVHHLSSKTPMISYVPINGSGRDSIKDNIMAQQVALQGFQDITDGMRKFSCEIVHLFFSGPYPIILFLGWLWNAGPSLKLYEFDKSSGQYFKTPYQPHLY